MEYDTVGHKVSVQPGMFEDAGAPPELAQALAHLTAIMLNDSLELARHQGAYEANIRHLKERLTAVEAAQASHGEVE